MDRKVGGSTLPLATKSNPLNPRNGVNVVDAMAHAPRVGAVLPWCDHDSCDSLDCVSFDDDWVNDAAHEEASARERELRARRERWAELDRADLQGNGDAGKRARQARRSERWRKSWPWLLFFALAAVLITGSRLLGF